MNVAGINAKVIFEANCEQQCIRRKFLKDLSLQLVKGQIDRRLQHKNLPRELAANVKKRCSEAPEREEPPPKKSTTLRRCYYCPRGKDRKSRYSCYKCDVCLCLEHIKPVCQRCTSTVEEEEL